MYTTVCNLRVLFQMLDNMMFDIFLKARINMFNGTLSYYGGETGQKQLIQCGSVLHRQQF